MDVIFVEFLNWKKSRVIQMAKRLKFSRRDCKRKQMRLCHLRAGNICSKLFYFDNIIQYLCFVLKLYIIAN